MFFRRSRCQNITSVGGQASEDIGHLPRRLSLTEDHFGHALAKGAMVVELGETQVLEGQVAEAFYGLVGGKALFSDFFEEFVEGMRIHEIVVTQRREMQLPL
jgi:hypothetical protein